MDYGQLELNLAGFITSNNYIEKIFFQWGVMYYSSTFILIMLFYLFETKYYIFCSFSANLTQHQCPNSSMKVIPNSPRG